MRTKPEKGFYACKGRPEDILEAKHRLQASGAEVFSDNQVVLASFQQFEDQGIWSDNGCAVVYDMDLTNFEDLCRLLEVASFSEPDKGRILFRLYENYGINFVDKLRGTFSFALWDGSQLFVATDPYGIKPVVYSDQGNGFSAATRIKYLLFDKTISRTINPDAVFQYLFFQAVCSPLTIYKNICKLEPGKAILCKNDQTTIHTYYDIVYRPEEAVSEAEWKQRIFDQVKKAVGVFIPLSPYEKTGCFLSGGTDSSSVVGFYGQLAGKPAHTFSIGFDDPKYNELEYARIAAERFKADYHEYYVTPQDVVELIQFLPRIYDEPFGNASVIPAYYCARHAAEIGIEILLGGDGGDEIFGGNERYVSNLVFQKYEAVPAVLRSCLIEPLVSFLPDQGLFHKAKRYIRRAKIPNPERFFSYNLLAETGLAAVFNPEFLEDLNPGSFLEIAEQHYQNAAPAHDTDRLLYLDMKFTITDNDIRKVTQMVEAAGIRVRYPLLDRDLVDFTATIPPELKVKWKKNRYIFKQAMKGFLPDPIIYKSKHGMGLPVTPWFKEDLQMNQLLYDNVFSSSARLRRYLKPDFIHMMKNSFENQSTTYFGDNLWVFLILELWLRQDG